MKSRSLAVVAAVTCTLFLSPGQPATADPPEDEIAATVDEPAVAGLTADEPSDTIEQEQAAVEAETLSPEEQAAIAAANAVAVEQAPSVAAMSDYVEGAGEVAARIDAARTAGVEVLP